MPARFIIWRENDRRYLILLVVLAALLGAVLAVFYLVFTTVRIDGDSMAPTLHDEDRILITKGYDTPARGDIVSAYVPDEHGQAVRVIKRVVALEGDTVEIFGDRAYVNGDLVTYGPPITGPGDARLDPYVVPEGTVFVLGDNRPYSYDSRFFGPVPLPVIRGKVVAIIMPLQRFTIID